MTFNVFDVYLNRAVEALAERISISESQHKRCAEHFRGITSLLNESEIKIFKPVLRVQGSGRLGTGVRSLSNEDGFDIDIVCELQYIPPGYTPKMVKEAIGRVLLNSGVYGNLIENKEGGKRCWTIQFKDGLHVDVLPAVVDDEYQNRVNSMQYKSFDDFGIRITDKTRLPEYYLETDITKWLLSNPIGFAEWFFIQARYHEAKHKSSSLYEVRASVEPYPEHNTSPFVLQNIIKLLKRHRDVMFQHRDKKPISMILTVLAAKAYITAPPGNLWATLKYVVVHLTEQMDTDFKTWKKVVLNPVNREENFCDRWTKDPEREKAFYEWVKQLNEDILSLERLPKVEMWVALKKMFGESAGTDVLKKITLAEKDEFLKKGISTAASGVIGVATAKANPPHTFFGK